MKKTGNPAQKDAQANANPKGSSAGSAGGGKGGGGDGKGDSKPGSSSGASSRSNGGSSGGGNGGKADGGGGGGGCKTSNSFTPGTKVLMADGSTKPIEDVQPGDKVIATSPETGETRVETVTAEIAGDGVKQLVKVTIDTDGEAGDKTAEVTATDGHPFWVPELDEWIDATDLRSGQSLQTSAGTHVQITAIERWTTLRAVVHNLTVRQHPHLLCDSRQTHRSLFTTVTGRRTGRTELTRITTSMSSAWMTTVGLLEGRTCRSTTMRTTDSKGSSQIRRLSCARIRARRV